MSDWDVWPCWPLGRSDRVATAALWRWRAGDVMRGTPHIVVGYDGSEHAGAAVDWAALEAAERQRALVVVHAADYPGEPGPLAPQVFSPERARRSGRQKAVEGAARAWRVAPGVDVRAEVKLADPVRALLGASRTAELVVVGNRGHSEAVEVLLGSVSFAVSARAHCPTVVVPRAARRRPGLPVVVGIDGRANCLRALSFAADVAVRGSAGLMVLTAVGQDEDDAARVANAACAAVRVQWPDLTDVRSTVVDAPAGEALVEASRDASLVVVGSRGRGGFSGLVSGSVSHDAIVGAACPVAVVGPECSERSTSWGTVSECSRGRTTCPPPNTSAPAR